MTVSPIAAAVACLRAALPGVPVGTKAPDEARYVRVVHTGGQRGRQLHHAQFVIECCAADSVTAEADAYAVDDALTAAPESGPWADGWISDWGPAVIADFPDPDKAGQSRFTVTGVLYLHT